MEGTEYTFCAYYQILSPFVTLFQGTVYLKTTIQNNNCIYGSIKIKLDMNIKLNKVLTEIIGELDTPSCFKMAYI